MENSQIDLTQDIKIITQEIVKANYERAIAQLLILSNKVNDDLLTNETILLISRFKALKKETNNLDRNAYNPERNNLVKSILELTTQFKDFVNSAYFKSKLDSNSNKISEIAKDVSAMKLKAIRNKESVKRNVELEFYVKKEQINRLGDCWAEIYQIEKRFFDIIKEIEKSSDKENFNHKNKIVDLNSKYPKDIFKFNLTSKEHEYFCNFFQELYNDYIGADLILEKSRYWLGDNLYKSARKYHDCFPSFFSFFKEKNYKQCGKCYKDMEGSKKEVANFISVIQSDIGL